MASEAALQSVWARLGLSRGEAESVYEVQAVRLEQDQERGDSSDGRAFGERGRNTQRTDSSAKRRRSNSCSLHHIGGTIYDSLSADERNRLCRQAAAMKDYLDILNDRINAF